MSILSANQDTATNLLTCDYPFMLLMQTTCTALLTQKVAQASSLAAMLCKQVKHAFCLERV